MDCIDQDDSGPLIQDVLVKQKAVLKGLDKTRALEQAFFEGHLDASGERMLEERVLRCLPTQEKAVDPTVAYCALMRLAEGGLHKFVGAGAEGKCQHVKKAVKAIESGQAPTIVGASASDFSLSAERRFAYFCRKPAASGSAEGAPDLVGRAALVAYLAALRAKTDITLSDLKMFHQFHWLLDAAEAQFIKEKTDSVIAIVDVALVAKKSSGGRKRKADLVAPKKDMVAHLFK